jgi:hypothetical protein
VDSSDEEYDGKKKGKKKKKKPLAKWVRDHRRLIDSYSSCRLCGVAGILCEGCLILIRSFLFSLLSQYSGLTMIPMPIGRSFLPSHLLCSLLAAVGNRRKILRAAKDCEKAFGGILGWMIAII